MTAPSHASEVRSNSWGWLPRANREPAGFRGCDQIRVARRKGTPSDFQSSQARPVRGSTKGAGSMDPAVSGSQTSGVEVLSTKGPSGFGEVANEMQKRRG